MGEIGRERDRGEFHEIFSGLLRWVRTEDSNLALSEIDRYLYMNRKRRRKRNRVLYWTLTLRWVR